MTNLQRLQMETKGIELDQAELLVYLKEHNLEGHEEYNAESATNKKQIYATALSILESLANNPTGMKSYKLDDMTISQFHENLLARIDQLEHKVRNLKTDEQVDNDSSFFMLFG